MRRALRGSAASRLHYRVVRRRARRGGEGMGRIEGRESAVIVVDAQEKLAAAMPAAQLAALTRAATVLVEAARTLGARVLATEQYPQGLGPTIPPIAEQLARANAT